MGKGFSNNLNLKLTYICIFDVASCYIVIMSDSVYTQVILKFATTPRYPSYFSRLLAIWLCTRALRSVTTYYAWVFVTDSSK